MPADSPVPGTPTDRILVPAHLVTATAGESTCPVCDRTWTVTPFDDCMLPACGCYGDDTSAANPHRICHRCGLAHARRCPKRKASTGA